MKRTAKQLAQRGRYGDTELLHVSRSELAALRGIGSLTGRRVTQNPDTGLPEAFNFTSLIPAIVGIGASVASGGTLTPLMAGMISGATTTAVTGDIKKGLISGISGGAMAGLGSGLSEIGTGAATTAGGAGADIGSGMMGAGLDGAAGDMASTYATQGAMDAGMGGAMDQGVVSAMDGAGSDLASSGMGGAAGGSTQPWEQMGVGLDGPAGDAAGTYATNPNTFSAENFMNNAGDSSKWDSAFMGDKFSTRTAPGLLALTSSVGGAMAPGMPEYTPEESSEFAKKEKRDDREYKGHSDPYYAMNGGEPQMFTDARYNFAQGGIVSLDNKQQDSGTVKAVRAIRSRYRSKQQAVEDMQIPGSFISRLGVRDPNDPIMQYAFGYTEKQGKKKMPTDRIVTPLDRMPKMREGGPVDGGWDRLEFRAMGDANDNMRVYGETINRKSGRIVDGETMKSKGHKAQTHEEIRAMERAADYLNNTPRKKMAGGGGIMSLPQAGGRAVEGPGDGMSDSIPAEINGNQPAALTDGEYVFPADAVSHLGNGSTKAGVKQLDNMVSRIRQARTGSAKQAPAINPRKVMPK